MRSPEGITPADSINHPCRNTEAQIKALGVRLSALSNSSTAPGAAYPATVELPPSSEQIVSAPSAGLVTHIPVRLNENVMRGQVVARLVSPELGAIQLQLVQSATRARLARQTASRERSLYQEGIIPLRRVQEADAQLAEAQAALSQAQAALELAGMARSDITRVLRSGKFDNNLALRAPATGTVIELNVKPGGSPAARISLGTDLAQQPFITQFRPDRDPFAQVRFIWLDHCRPGIARLVRRRRQSLPDVLAHCLAIMPSALSNG